MAKLGVIYTIITCAALILTQAAFFFIPSGFFRYYQWGVFPVVYALLAVGAVAFFGKDQRIVKKAYQSNILAIIGLLLYASMILIVSVLFGAARNAILPGFGVAVAHFWTMALPLLLGEFVRFKLIKSAEKEKKFLFAMFLAVVFAFANLSELRIIFNQEQPNLALFLFEGVLPVVTASVVVSLVAVNGSLFSVLLLSFVFNLGSTFSPILPNIPRIAWSLVICGLMFVVALLNYYLTNDTVAAQRKRIARTAKLISNNPAKYIVGFSLTAFLITFFMQLFPVYPVVILTGSMTGYIDRGSMVIMRRIPPDEVHNTVEIGDVLHYRFRTMELVHRVVDFSYTEDVVREFVTQGDANEFPDPETLAQENVLGTPIFTIPFFGYPTIIFRAVFGGIF